MLLVYRLKLLWFLLFSFLLILAVSVGLYLFHSYQNIYKAETARLDQQTKVVHDNLNRELLELTNALDTASHLVAYAESKHDDLKELDSYTHKILGSFIGISTINYVDHNGIIQSSTQPQLIGLDVSQLERFRYIKSRNNPQLLYISEPFITPVGSYGIGISRIVQNHNGKFQGYLMAVLNQNYFHTLLNSVLYAPDVFSSIIHTDGIVIYRFPEYQYKTGADLRKLPKDPFWDLMAGEKPDLITTGIGFDDKKRLIAFKVVESKLIQYDKKLVFKISRKMESVFSTWHNQVKYIGALFGIIALISVVAMFFFQSRQKALIRSKETIEAEKNKANERIFESEQRFRNMFTYLPVAYQSLDIAGCWLDSNQHMADLLGFKSTQDMIGQDFSTFWDDEFRSKFDAAYDEFKSTHNVEGEIKLKRLDGKIISVLITGKIQRDTEGNFLCTHCIVVDNSERKAFAEQLIQLNLELEKKVKERTNELEAINNNLIELSRSDALTKLPNRLAADERLRAEFIRMKRSNIPYAVMMVDIDYFKKVNDTYGHDIGDCVLQHVSKVIQSSLRENDFVCRLGGEEFLVLLPSTEPKDAFAVGEKLRVNVELSPEPTAGISTISIGLAMGSMDDASEHEAIKRSDLKLYEAKKTGRNRTVI